MSIEHPGRLPQNRPVLGTACLLTVLLLGACSEPSPEPAESVGAAPHVAASSPAEAGRYLAVVAGCNDCHTDGYLMTGGQVPEEEWLAGSAMGWRGPWGTTYATNLRLRVQEMTEDDWVATIHFRKDLPPMPWMNVNQMSESDARALYTYIKSLGARGDHVPPPVPPGEEPSTPYLSLEPLNLPAQTDSTVPDGSSAE